MRERRSETNVWFLLLEWREEKGEGVKKQGEEGCERGV